MNRHIITNHGTHHGTAWRTVGYTRFAEPDHVQSLTDLEFKRKGDSLWHPDAFQTFQEETGRQVPMNIVKRHNSTGTA